MSMVRTNRKITPPPASIGDFPACGEGGTKRRMGRVWPGDCLNVGAPDGPDLIEYGIEVLASR